MASDKDNTSIFVRQAVAGDSDGIAWVVAHFQPFVEAQVRLRLRGHGTQQDVEDLAADVWVITLGNLSALQPRAGRLAPVLMTYLGTTVLQCCNNLLRRRVREAQRGGAATPAAAAGDTSAGPGPSQLPADTLGVVTRAVHRELGDAVLRCLDDLSEDKRHVLVLRLMEQRSNQEIAAMLRIPANTVAVRYKRAMEELRSALPAEVFEDIRAAVQ